MMRKKQNLTPPPTKSPLARRERGTGKLACWPYASKADKLAGVVTPYAFDENGRPLWKFVLRHERTSVVIPARDWPHAHNESLKRLGRWDHITAAKAERAARKVAKRKATPSVAALKWSDVTQQWLASLRQRGKPRPSTIMGYTNEIERHLDPFFVNRHGDPLVTAVTPQLITECLTWNKAKGHRSWRPVAKVLAMLLKYAYEMELIHRSPFKPRLHAEHDTPQLYADDAPAQTALSAADLDAILERAKQHPDPRVAVAVVLAGFGGLRLDEAIHVRLRDLTICNVMVDLKVATGVRCDCRTCAKDGGVQRTKNGEARFVPLLPTHGTILKEHIVLMAQYGLTDPDTWLLTTLYRRERSKARRGDMMNRDTLAEQVKTVIESTLGVTLAQRERFHVLRHGARTRLSHLGLPTEMIDLMMGHKLRGMAATYTHQDRELAWRTLCDRAGETVVGPALRRIA